MATYSDHAVSKLQDLYKNHSNQVGSKLKREQPIKYKDFEATDCITYVIAVLKHAFKSVGDEGSAKRVGSLGKYGTELAKYLVETHKWKGIFLNADVRHPEDGLDEHVAANRIAAAKCSYYEIPVQYRLVNYRLTPKSDADYGKYTKKETIPSPDELISAVAIHLVKFGFGVSKGGMHTWLFSYGNVYEVHWGESADSGNLYEARSLVAKFPLFSGALVVPPDQAASLASIAKQSCG
jgi:hypothetical protein